MQAPQLSQEELQRAREAITCWYRAHYRSLRDWVAVRLRGLPPAFKAEDIVQEALARLWEGITTGRVGDSVWGNDCRLECWLRHACEHIISECRRKRRKERLFSVAFQLPAEDEVPSEGTSPARLTLYQLSELSRWLRQHLYSPSAEEALETEHWEEVCTHVRERVWELSEPYRQIVLLRYWEAACWDEIADETGIAVRSLYRRHREVLGVLHSTFAPLF